MAQQIDGSRAPARRNETSDPRAWRPGMVYVSPVTGKRTTNPADVPYTAEWNARQAAASSSRYTGGTNGLSPVVTYTPGSSGGSGGSGVYGGSGGSAAAAAAAAEAAARAAANSSARNAAISNKNALQQAIDAALSQKNTNQAKLDALTKLVKEDLAKSRDSKVAAISADLAELMSQAQANYATTLGDINTGLRSNEKAESDSTFANLANRAREKMDLVTQALSMGAGESDVLKSQLQALRNWDANQGEINRSYFDTLNSTNATLNDLNIGTKTTLTGYELEANQRLSSVWDDFFQAMSDSYTQMDNLATNNYLLDAEIAANQANMGQQDALLAWLDSGKNAEDFKAQQLGANTVKPYEGFADEAAEWAGKTWENPGVSEATKNWQGQEAQRGQLNTSQAWNAQTNTADKGAATKKRPEGATLRRW